MTKTIEIVHKGTGEVIARQKTPAEIVARVLVGIKATLGDDYTARTR